jgi:hypothetical protein
MFSKGTETQNSSTNNEFRQEQFTTYLEHKVHSKENTLTLLEMSVASMLRMSVTSVLSSAHP